MGAPRPAELHLGERPPEWAIPCPVQHCLARPGAACTAPTGRRLTAGSHPSRYDAWLTQQYTAATPDGGNDARLTGRQRPHNTTRAPSATRAATDRHTAPWSPT